jgi:ABC-2 type transport system ATP-binding protein
MTAPPAIQTVSLRRSFGPVEALRGFDLEIRKGEIYGLVGPDGAGKTTAMRILCGIMEPTSGEVRLLGRPPQEVRSDIGYMPQRFGLYEDLTVRENLYFYADLFGVRRRQRDARLARLLSFSQLEPFQGRRAGHLSGGMKQKLALACALIHTPQVLLLDEPTCGVDPVSRRDFWRILYELLREGVTMLVSTAYLDEAERCHRVGLLHRGRLLEEGPPERILSRVPGRIFEIEVEEARSARCLVEGLAGVLQIGVFGQRLHVALEGEDALSRVLAALAAAGLDVASSREIAPTLEDAFIALIGEAAEEEAR